MPKMFDASVRRLLRLWADLVHFISWEFLLEKRANGGAVIFLRAILVGTGVYALTIGVKNFVDPDRILRFSLHELQIEIRSTLPWFGAIFAAVYAALYTRFSSQWLYLAGVYNAIKQAEARLPTGCSDSQRVLADWKAGFIEDAQEAHLATKPVFASVITAWARNQQVKSAFVENTPRGELKLGALLKEIGECRDRRDRRSQDSSGPG